MNSKDIKSVPFVWEENTMNETGFTAQEVVIDLSDYNISSDTLVMSSPSTQTVTSVTGPTSFNWSSGSTITLTDPYEEMEKRLAALEEIIAEEKKIRDECPAVRNAYDEYRFLLVLAKRHGPTNLTDE